MLGKKKRWLLAGLFLLTCNVALAQNEQFSEGENNQNTFQTLETNISIQFFETRCEDVLKEMEDQTGLTFLLDESAADNNLDGESLINLTLENKRVATVLAFMLREFQCSWSIHDGVVVIVSEDAALDQLNLKVFNCSDLLARIQPRVVRRGSGFGGRGSGGGGFGGGGGSMGGGVFAVQEDEHDPFADGGASEMSDPFADDRPELEDDPFADDAVQEEPSDNRNPGQQLVEQEAQTPATPRVLEVILSPQEQLVDLIQKTVDPNSWEENGGNARIVTINDLVVVRQTQVNLREIDTLLELLRSSGL